MSASCEDFDSEAWFIGLARRKVRWTFRQPNARRAEVEKAAKPDSFEAFGLRGQTAIV